MLDTLKKVCHDCTTTSHGHYDPARVIGYFIVILGALEFLALFGYFAIKDGKFDASSFALGLASVAGTLITAAVGVMIKHGTEAQPPQQ